MNDPDPTNVPRPCWVCRRMTWHPSGLCIHHRDEPDRDPTDDLRDTEVRCPATGEYFPTAS